eukprot:NODE_2033_length_1318_cov_23.319149_g1848_i0.p1 GENE.NODE_2033_length_1318_cov_23.319149_g1848_i0~~NODE_2033_length_1318_cov_23.319149_g1848_i0.p1  ORF type:complete len:408 (-),score=56.16 NODE_2033_length_1318_cov_23.319149_g1848_i0:95-1222(-)
MSEGEGLVHLPLSGIHLYGIEVRMTVRFLGHSGLQREPEPEPEPEPALEPEPTPEPPPSVTHSSPRVCAPPSPSIRPLGPSRTVRLTIIEVSGVPIPSSGLAVTVSAPDTSARTRVVRGSPAVWEECFSIAVNRESVVTLKLREGGDGSVVGSALLDGRWLLQASGSRRWVPLDSTLYKAKLRIATEVEPESECYGRSDRASEYSASWAGRKRSTGSSVRVGLSARDPEPRYPRSMPPQEPWRSGLVAVVLDHADRLCLSPGQARDGVYVEVQSGTAVLRTESQRSSRPTWRVGKALPVIPDELATVWLQGCNGELVGKASLDLTRVARLAAAEVLQVNVRSARGQVVGRLFFRNGNEVGHSPEAHSGPFGEWRV